MFDRLRNAVDALFKDNGWLTANGYSNKQEQKEYTLSIIRALEAGSKLHLLEASTGVGKSFGYLFPLLAYAGLSKKKVIVCTHSIALQKSLMGQPLAMALSALEHFDIPHPITGQRIGMHHYLDIRRVESVCNENKGAYPRKSSEFLEWAKHECSHGTGLIESWLDANQELPFELVETDICIRPYSNNATNLRYLKDKEESKEYGLTFTSHMMLLSSLTNNTLGAPSTGDVVLIDEADTINSTAEQITDKHINITQIYKLIDSLNNVLTVKGKNIASDIKSLIDTFNSSIPTIEFTSYSFQSTDEAEHHKSILLDISHKLVELQNKIKTQHQDSSAAYRLYEMAFNAAYIIKSLDKYISIFSIYTSNKKDRGYVAGSTRPLGIVRTLLKKQVTLIGTSATLIDRHKMSKTVSFNGFIAKTGVCPSLVGETCKLEPKSYGSMDFFICKPSFPPPFIKNEEFEINQSWVRNVSTLITNLLESGEKVLVLSSSYNETFLLQEALGKTAYCHTTGSVSSSFEEALLMEAPVFITPAGWSGLNYRNTQNEQYFTSLVITKIPFIPPSKVELVKIASQLAKTTVITPSESRMAEKILQSRVREETVKKLTQGLGRGIRNDKEHINVYVTDPRFPKNSETNKRYKFIENAIPARFKSKLRCAKMFDVVGNEVTIVRNDRNIQDVCFL